MNGSYEMTGLSDGGTDIFGDGYSFLEVIPNTATIRSITIMFGTVIDSIIIKYLTDCDRIETLPIIGGSGGDHSVVIEMTPNDRIINIQGNAGTRLDSIIFTTTNTKSNVTTEWPKAGGSGGDRPYNISTNKHVIGLYGRSGMVLNKIGLITKP